mgnify:CR=1 FL=1
MRSSMFKIGAFLGDICAVLSVVPPPKAQASAHVPGTLLRSKAAAPYLPRAGFPAAPGKCRGTSHGKPRSMALTKGDPIK